MKLSAFLIILAPLVLLHGLGGLVAWLVVRNKRTAAPPHQPPGYPQQPPGYPQQQAMPQPPPGSAQYPQQPGRGQQPGWGQQPQQYRGW